MAANQDVVLVMLRQPKLAPTESRTDPLYEFGSFGLTGCHSTNLLYDDAADGARLAFAQGGSGEVRLIYVSPPVRVINHGRLRACSWTPTEMPLRYDRAPILIDNAGRSDVSGLSDLIRRVARSTWVGRFSSRFRSRKEPLPNAVAHALLHSWDQAAKELGPSQRAHSYWDALPYAPPLKDMDRRATYDRLLLEAAGELVGPPPMPSGSSAPPKTTPPRRSRC